MSIPPRPDEVALWNAVVAGEYPAEAVVRLGIRPGRAEYLFLKWAGKRRWNFGVSPRTGWVEGDPSVPPWAPKDTPIRVAQEPWQEKEPWRLPPHLEERLAAALARALAHPTEPHLGGRLNVEQEAELAVARAGHRCLPGKCAHP